MVGTKALLFSLAWNEMQQLVLVMNSKICHVSGNKREGGVASR